jgi:hypothetical protein
MKIPVKKIFSSEEREENLYAFDSSLLWPNRYTLVELVGKDLSKS